MSTPDAWVKYAAKALEREQCRHNWVEADFGERVNGVLVHGHGEACTICYAHREAQPEDVWDPADDMCPNCVTPWKCNGPHLSR